MDKDLWFRLHQIFMTSALVFTVIGIIIILIDKGFSPFDGISNNPHPVFGLIVFIGALIQPIMAFFRPHPGTDYRLETLDNFDRVLVSLGSGSSIDFKEG